MRKEYRQTIQLYKKLGAKYLKDISRGVPSTMVNFIKIIPRNSLILDVGCAGGRDSKRFVQAGHRIIGIDIIETFLKEARKNVPQAKFKKMDLMRLKFPANYFDAIWAMAVLLHFSKNDVKHILKSFYKNLKPGGILHIGLKRGKGEKMVREKLSNNQYRFFVFWYKYEIEKLLRKCNFKILQSIIIPDSIGRSNVKFISVIAKKV